MSDSDFGCYPGTTVLRNKLGLRDEATLRQVEYQITADRTRDAPSFPPTRAGYQALHRHLFSEVFEWAGELRTVDFTKGGSLFASARFLDITLDKLFGDLASHDHLRGLGGERFAERAAHHVSELNVAHPFREGNGRTMRVHLSQLAEQAGHRLHVTRMPEPAWIEASIRGYEGDEQPMALLIAGAIEPARLIQPEAALAELRDALEPARQEIVVRTRAVRDLIERSGSPGRFVDEVRGLRAEMERLRDPAVAIESLDAMRGTAGWLGVLAGPGELARERVHAILGAVARGLAEPARVPAAQDGVQAAPPPMPGTTIGIMDTLRPPAAGTDPPWDAALTPLAPRLAAYLERKAREADKGVAPPAAKTGTAGTRDAEPSDEPRDKPARPNPGRDPGPGF